MSSSQQEHDQQSASLVYVNTARLYVTETVAGDLQRSFARDTETPTTIYRVVQNKWDPDLFFDNFGKSTPILTILSPLQQEIHGA